MRWLLVLIACVGCSQRFPELSEEEALAERRQAYREHWKEVQAERQKGVDAVKQARMKVRLRERKRYLGY